MLLQLNINNFTLIDKISINFENGFNVLTGETGTGKSILIDAINFVLGGKFNKGIIRNGEERAYVEGVFSTENKKTIEILEELEIEVDEVLIISREIFSNGRSISKVNNTTIILSKLRDLSSSLLDIHGQHENINLLNPSLHLYYLDKFGEDKICEDLERYKEAYRQLIAIDKKIESLFDKSSDKNKVLDYLKYQIDDIEKAKLKIGEYEELSDRFKILSNSEKINMSLSRCDVLLNDGAEGENSILGGIISCVKDLRNVEKHSEEILKIANSLDSCFYILKETSSDLKTLKEELIFDESELEEINSRIYFIDDYKRKYGKNVEEILELKNKISIEYYELLNSIEIIEKLNKEKDEIKKNMKIISKKISVLRFSLAKKLQIMIKDELNHIGLEKSLFQVDIIYNDEKLGPSGADSVAFKIATNPGEPLTQIDKVVSGGELSRIMLALKTVFIDKDNIPSVIFDEIDTGISGRVAVSVGEKMFKISTKHQVFCVTHLPQIAAMSDVHFLVSKETIENKTYSKITKLTKEGKIEELARLSGGTEVSNITLSHAEEMVKMAENKKKSILATVKYS